MLFGGTKVPEEYLWGLAPQNNTIVIDGMGSFDSLLFLLFRTTLAIFSDAAYLVSNINIISYYNIFYVILVYRYAWS